MNQITYLDRNIQPFKCLNELTQLGGLAEDEGVGPELADGATVEAAVAHRLPEAAAHEHVQHVRARPQGADDAAGGEAREPLKTSSATRTPGG